MRQRKLAALMLLLTVFDLSLILVRMYLNRTQIVSIPDSVSEIAATRGITFLFLAWNLLLAWVPYLISIILVQLAPKNHSRLHFKVLFALWLVFFPNAPYLVTDLIHLHPRPNVPVWFDLFLLFSYAFSGLLLCFLSLRNIQLILEPRLKRLYANGIIFLLIGLAAVGVWLGRFLRWNSWDVATNPGKLVEDLITTFSQKYYLIHASVICCMMTMIMAFGYAFFTAFMPENSKR